MSAKRIRKLTARNAVRRAALFASEKQALNIVVLDLRGSTDFTDYFLICTGVVDVHVQAIGNYIEEKLSTVGWKPRHIEGQQQNRWVLLDYIDFIVHIFQPEARDYYAIERFWGDAPEVIIKGIDR